jgi:hypothetical protein
MARKKGMGKIFGFKPMTLAVIGVGAYLLKDKLFKKPMPTTMTATNNPNNVVTP